MTTNRGLADEFGNRIVSARTGMAKNVWLLAVLLIFSSTNLSHLPWYAAKLGVGVVAARQRAAQANLDANSAFQAGAQEKQLSVNERFDGEWSAAYKTFEMQPASAEHSAPQAKPLVNARRLNRRPLLEQSSPLP